MHHIRMSISSQVVNSFSFTIFRNYAFTTEILAASIRSPMHVVRSAELGADVVTIPHKVMMQLIRHPLTDIGLENFLADARRAMEDKG